MLREEVFLFTLTQQKNPGYSITHAPGFFYLVRGLQETWANTHRHTCVTQSDVRRSVLTPMWCAPPRYQFFAERYREFLNARFRLQELKGAWHCPGFDLLHSRISEHPDKTRLLLRADR